MPRTTALPPTHLSLLLAALVCGPSLSAGAPPGGSMLTAAGVAPSGAAVLPIATLTMEEAVSMALKQSPALEVARRERNVALLGVDRARPAFRPEVTATASQILRTPRVDLPGRSDEVVLPNSGTRFEIGLKQPIYQFGIGDAPGKRADALAAAAHSDYRKSELDLVLEVREAYLELLRALAYSDVARRGVTLAQENVRLTTLLKERGLQADVDVLEAERAQAEAESGLLQAENGVDLARGNVNRVIGRSLETVFMPGSLVALPGEPAPQEELVKRAMAQRPEAEKIRSNIEAAQEGIKLVKASNQPRVNLEAGYAYQTPTALVPRSGISAGLSISVPIFDGAVRSFNRKEAGERLEQLRSAMKQLEAGVGLEVLRHRLAMVEARKRMDVADRTVAAAQQVYDITVLKLERGHAVQAEVLNARLSLQKALTSRTTAEYDLRLASSRLDRAVADVPAGGLPEADPGSEKPEGRPSGKS